MFQQHEHATFKVQRYDCRVFLKLVTKATTYMLNLTPVLETQFQVSFLFVQFQT